MKWRPLLLAALGAAGLFALTAAWPHGARFRAAPGAAQAQDARPADTFRRVWAQPLLGLRAAGLSPDGEFVVTTDGGGRVRLWDWQRRPDRALWSSVVPGVSRAAVGDGGHRVLAYAPLDPTRPTLAFLGDGGRLTARSTLDGAIWDAALSADGGSAGVTTGAHSLYLYTLGGPPTRRQWRLPGVGDSVALSADASWVAAGTWDGSGVACYTPQGAALWQYRPLDSQAHAPLADRLFETQIAGSGRAVLGLSYANVRAGDGTLLYWRGRGGGAPAWTRALGADAFGPQARVSADGSCVAVTYTRDVTHGDQEIAEQRLLVLDADGDTLWEKGGLLFAPTLVSVAADGHRVTVSDGRDTLYDLNDRGRITAPYHFHNPIRQTVASADGRWLLVYTGDGQLSLMQLG